MADSINEIISFNKNSNNKIIFNGWILPNGLVISKDDTLYNHRIIVEYFINGLEKYDYKRYLVLEKLYSNYQNYYLVNGDIHDSFAVEILGWIQVNNKNISYRGEKWQDNIIYPLFNIPKMKYSVYDKLYCQNSKFFDLYDEIDRIMELGKEKNKVLQIKK